MRERSGCLIEIRNKHLSPHYSVLSSQFSVLTAVLCWDTFVTLSVCPHWAVWWFANYKYLVAQPGPLVCVS